MLHLVYIYIYIILYILYACIHIYTHIYIYTYDTRRVLPEAVSDPHSADTFTKSACVQLARDRLAVIDGVFSESVMKEMKVELQALHRRQGSDQSVAYVFLCFEKRTQGRTVGNIFVYICALL